LFVHTLRIVQYLIVPETKHPIAIGFNYSGSRCIDLSCVQPAIGLDNQLRAVACGIDDVLADEDLSAQPCSWEALAEQAPKAFFGLGGVCAQAAGRLGVTRGRDAFHPCSLT
jgi:hypothetical protein